MKFIILELLAVSFNEEDQWEFKDGKNVISAKMHDVNFLQKVHRREVTFSEGDMLAMDIYTKVSKSGDDLKTEYIVTRVQAHIRRYTNPNPPYLDVI